MEVGGGEGYKLIHEQYQATQDGTDCEFHGCKLLVFVEITNILGVKFSTNPLGAMVFLIGIKY
jgi:hypothetical protein